MHIKGRVMVTGGAGYVGSVLVPKLLDSGYEVCVYDICMFGTEPLKPVSSRDGFCLTIGDIRDQRSFSAAVKGCNAVIHLACVSNDPSFELDPFFGKSINYDCFPGLVSSCKDAGVSRFVYASSSSVYGVKEEKDVTEDLPLDPLTDYSKYKALCEEILDEKRSPGFAALTIRPATVCGLSPRLRLDLAVNILTHHACTERKIRVFGGAQMRPNIHIQDMTDLYVQSLGWPESKIDGKVFNAGYENYSVGDIANIVRGVVGADVEIVTTPTDDMRSYHISSSKIERELGFVPKHTIEDAIRELAEAFASGKVHDPVNDPKYYNIKVVKRWIRDNLEGSE